jgi:plastocyanin
MQQLRSSRSVLVGAIVVGVFVLFGVATLAQNNSGLPQGYSYSAPPAVQAQQAAPSAPAQAQDAAPSAQTQGGTAVTISNFAFQPASLQITAGSSVTWTNQDSTAHTVTSDSGAFDSGALAPGASFTQMFMTPGTYTYHCQIHPFMTATIVVS